jgi:hypothetical protein
MSRSIKLLVAASLAILVLIPTAAIASHQFSDVPTSNIFHDDVSWLADNDITKGCNPPVNDNYCPDDSVTREQMAAFLHRLGDRVTSLTETGQRSQGTSFNDDAIALISLGIDVPSNNGVLAVTASGTFFDKGSGETDGIAWVEFDSGGACSGWDDKTIPNGSFSWDADGSQSNAGMATVASAVVTAGNHTIDVCGKHFGTLFDFDGKAVATWTPAAP